jgi:hypothetical protein
LLLDLAEVDSTFPAAGTAGRLPGEAAINQSPHVKKREAKKQDNNDALEHAVKLRIFFLT